MTFERGTALEFFAGIGLARMGLEAAGWRVTWANDIDRKKKEMHEGHWGPDPSYHLGSVFDVNVADLPPAELAWASFPCVDLSLAGNRAGLRGRSSSAYWGFEDLLRAMPDRPPLVVLENVPGLLTTHNGDDFLSILGGLADLGYQLDVLEVNAHHFVPQSRPRVFVIGVKAPYQLDTLDPGISASPLRPASVLKLRKTHPELPWGFTPNSCLPRRQLGLEDVLERFPDNADLWWSQDAVDRLLRQMSERHRIEVAKLQAAGRTSFATVYRRVRPRGYVAEARFDGLAGCLRTPRGGSSRQFVLEMGYGRTRARAMTPVEYGRLQGAHEFKIRVPANQAMYGFGDAVCVPAVTWLAEKCLEPIRQGVQAQGQGRQLELVT